MGEVYRAKDTRLDRTVVYSIEDLIHMNVYLTQGHIWNRVNR